MGATNSRNLCGAKGGKRDFGDGDGDGDGNGDADGCYEKVTYTTAENAEVRINANAYSGGVLLRDGRVVLVPYKSKCIAIFNPATNFLSTIAGAPGDYAYSDGVLLPDGRVVFVPYNATTIGIFDPATNAYSTVAGAPGAMAYSGGVLLPDGRVVFVLQRE